MSESESTKQLHRAYHTGDAGKTSGVYNEWAADYEAHMKNVGYTHPALVAAMLSRHLPATGDEVLDAGAGTGIMGEILTALGFSNLAGLDASEGMLEKAAAKDIYGTLVHAFLGGEVPFPDNRFAASVSAGVFTQSHAPLSGLDDLIRVVRPGGLIVFSISRTYLDGPFAEKREALEAAGRWEFVDRTELYNSTPLEDSLISQVYAFRV